MLMHLAGAALIAVSVAPQARAAPELAERLREADRLAWLTDWYAALPIYAEVEKRAVSAGNRRDAMYARFGRLRGLMQTLPLPDISEQIAADLESPLAKRDSRLRLRGLTVKGDIDLEWTSWAPSAPGRMFGGSPENWTTKAGRIAPMASWESSRS